MKISEDTIGNPTSDLPACSAVPQPTAPPRAPYGKGKAITLQPWTGPEGSRRLRLPDFKTIGTGRWEGCQPYAPATFTPRKYSWYSYLLEAESTPGPY